MENETKTIAREGKCIDCDARIAIFTDGTRTPCICTQLGMTPLEYAFKFEGYCGYCKCAPCRCDGHGGDRK
jgi:hypothetical protein